MSELHGAHARAGLVPLALLACCGCLASPQYRSMGPAFDERGSDGLEQREWAMGALYAVQHDSSPPDGIEDGLGLSLGGGYDLVGDPLRLAFEGEIGWSGHDTDWDPIDPDDGDNVGLFRASMGLRLWYRPDPGGLLSPYVRAGGFGRWLYTLYGVDDADFLNRPDVEETVYGVYYGGGLQFRFAPGAYFGPFVLRLDGQGDDEGQDEVLIGIGSTFRL